VQFITRCRYWPTVKDQTVCVKNQDGTVKNSELSVKSFYTKLSKLNRKTESDIDSINSSDSLNLTTDLSKNDEDVSKNEASVKSFDSSEMVKKLRGCGVFLKTAMGLVQNFEEEKIEEKIKYFYYALEKRLASSPGWLVLAIKEDWQAPLGYQGGLDAHEDKYAGWKEDAIEFEEDEELDDEFDDDLKYEGEGGI
jgi:hypothetical protein